MASIVATKMIGMGFSVDGREVKRPMEIPDRMIYMLKTETGKRVRVLQWKAHLEQVATIHAGDGVGREVSAFLKGKSPSVRLGNTVYRRAA